MNPRGYTYDANGNVTQEMINDFETTKVNMDYSRDWRGRTLATKTGAASSLGEETDGAHRPIVVYTLDNLGEHTQTDTFDGHAQKVPTAKPP